MNTLKLYLENYEFLKMHLKYEFWENKKFWMKKRTLFLNINEKCVHDN